jgi:hypothetical protein
MVTTSLLDIDMDKVLAQVERLAHVKLPRDVIEVSLEPKLKMLCIRFKKPLKIELGEPVTEEISLFTDKDTDEVTAVEVFNLEKLKLAS